MFQVAIHHQDMKVSTITYSTVGSNILKIIKIDKCEQLLQFYTFLCVNKSVIHFTNVTCCLQNLKFLKLLYSTGRKSLIFCF